MKGDRFKCALLLVFTLGSIASAPARPAIVQRGTDFELVLPRAIQVAIQSTIPEFQLWRQDSYSDDARGFYKWERRQHRRAARNELPWAVLGDFNGDGRRDVVLDGHVGTICYRICVWSRKARPTVEILKRYGCGETSNLGSVLVFRGRGRHGTMFDDVILKNDGFEEYFVDKAGVIWSWDGSWKGQQSSD